MPPRRRSSSSSADSCCCCSCINYIIGLGFIALSTWLICFLPSNPLLSIEQLSIIPPPLNTTTTTATTVLLDVKCNNRNFNKGIYYSAINLTLYYPQNLSFPVAYLSIHGFYQGYRKKAHKKVTGELLASDTTTTAAGDGTTVFQVDVKTFVKYKTGLVKFKRHRLVRGGTLTVNATGELVKKHNKGVKLSSASSHLSYCPHIPALPVLAFLLLLLCS